MALSSCSVFQRRSCKLFLTAQFVEMARWWPETTNAARTSFKLRTRRERSTVAAVALLVATFGVAAWRALQGEKVDLVAELTLIEARHAEAESASPVLLIGGGLAVVVILGALYFLM